MTDAQVGRSQAVVLRRDGHAGHIILNRPRALNALNHDMIRSILKALRDWAADDSIRTVVLTGAGSRALCAGGDVVAIWRDVAAGGGEDSRKFWADEYQLNALIAEYPKPYVAIMDGLVMGGGVGLSAHAQRRVVTERSIIGMPETGIGFLPDVGATFLLSRMMGEAGTHVALTGAPVGGSDAIYLGLADCLVPSDELPALLEGLAWRDPDDVLGEAGHPPAASALELAQGWVDAAYSSDDVSVILERLRSTGAVEADHAAGLIESRSPTAVKVTLRALREAADMSRLSSALEAEYRVAVRLLTSHDFAEGVRAQLIDKDRAPQWLPADLASVSEALVAGYFEPLGVGELQLDPTL